MSKTEPLPAVSRLLQDASLPEGLGHGAEAHRGEELLSLLEHLLLGPALAGRNVQMRVRLNHTLSIWLEMEFTSDIFLKTSVCVDYSQTIFKKQIKSIFI